MEGERPLVPPLNPEDVYHAEPQGEVPAGKHIPFHSSVEIPGLNANDLERFGEEMRGGVLGRTIVDFRDRGYHVATRIKTGGADIWAGEHRPIITKVMATAFTAAVTASTVILIRKSRQKK